MSDDIPKPNKVIPDPDMKSLLDLFKQEIFISLNCHALATVQSFDSAKQTVKATLNYKRSFGGKLSDYPVLVDVPIIILTGGKAALTMPIASGDTCLILFNDRDIDNWFSGGQVAALASQRMHSFSDGIALIGLRSSKNPVDDYDEDRAVLKNDKAKVAVGASLIEISNNLYNLNSILQELVTEINTLVAQTAAITVTAVVPGPGVSGPPANAAAITAIAAQLTATAVKIAGLLE